jgi:hypothetical protein
MIANRNASFLRFLLFDDEPVKMRFDVARHKMEFEFVVSVFCGFSSSFDAGSGSVIVTN